jgi:hypothetical protein
MNDQEIIDRLNELSKELGTLAAKYRRASEAKDWHQASALADQADYCIRQLEKVREEIRRNLHAQRP